MKKYVLMTMIFAASAAQAERLTFPKYAALVEKHAAAQRLDPKMIWAVMGRESSGNPNALSHKNARGLMQVIPPTATRMGVNPKHLYHPEPNLIAGTRYLRFLCNRYPDKKHPTGCNIDLVLAGYNAGEGAVDKYRGIPPYAETRAYVKNVKYRYARLSGNYTYAASSGETVVKATYQVKSVGKKKTGSVGSTTYAQAPKQFAEWDIFQEF